MSCNKNRNPEIKISSKDINVLITRIKSKEITESDYPLLEQILTTFSDMVQTISEKNISLKRVFRIFSLQSERRRKLKKKNRSTTKKSSNNDKKKAPGHGRNGVSDFNGGDRCRVNHPELKIGDRCPGCDRGNLYEQKNRGFVIYIKGNAPLSSTVFDLQVLRCNSCQDVFRTPIPGEAAKGKYADSAYAMLALLKYGCGMPFHRLKNLQKDTEIPLPASTQWKLVRDFCTDVVPVYYQLVSNAAQGEVLHHDDTRVLILDLAERMLPNAGSERNGLFTTAIVSKMKDCRIALYFSGQNHAGENLARLLFYRHSHLPPPIQMCDALSRNMKENLKTLIANCLAHGRRQFLDLLDIFPQESEHVIDQIGEVYKIDRIAKKLNMSPGERLKLHQKKSRPIMEDLKLWFKSQFEEKKIEPNSSFGKAINYMLKHWEKLTLFLRIENAPLDNNLCEMVLKCAILNRKNSMFYKTQNGSMVGDIFMSIIQTCRLARINTFDYLTKLKRYADKVELEPEKWLPWNYKSAMVTK
jgi:hypothetical protein